MTTTTDLVDAADLAACADDPERGHYWHAAALCKLAPVAVDGGISVETRYYQTAYAADIVVAGSYGRAERAAYMDDDARGRYAVRYHHAAQYAALASEGE